MMIFVYGQVVKTDENQITIESGDYTYGGSLEVTDVRNPIIFLRMSFMMISRREISSRSSVTAGMRLLSRM